MIIISQTLNAGVMIGQQIGLIEGYFTWAGYGTSERRIYGLARGPSQISYLLAFGVIITVGMASVRWSRWSIIGWVFVVPWICSAILLAQTRTALAGLVFGIIGIYIRQRGALIRILLALPIIGGSLAVGTVIFDGDFSRLSHFNLTNRFRPWWNATMIGMRNPFGSGTVEYLDPLTNGGVDIEEHAQSDLFYFFGTMGWPGLLMILGFYIAILSLCFLYLRIPTRSSQPWQRCLYGIIGCWFAYNLTEITFSGYYWMGIFCIILAPTWAYADDARNWVQHISDQHNSQMLHAT
jgi:hypothetical protein